MQDRDQKVGTTSEEDLRGGESGFWGSLFRQSEGELLEKKEKVRFGMGVAGENDFASIGGGQMDIEHLHGGELFEDRAWGESAGPGFEAGLEGDLKTVGQEGDKDVGFDPFLTLVVDGPDGQIAFEFLEGLFDLCELQVIFPKFGRVVPVQIGAQ